MRANEPIEVSAGIELATTVGTLARAVSLSWYVASTCPRHEKHVAQQLEERHIGSFLPLYTSVRRWKDRRKRLDLPLFPGYVFVQMTDENRLDIVRLPGVIQLVSFQGKPAAVSMMEIDALRRGMAGSVLLNPHPFLRAGRRVRIITGPMAGVEGIFLRRKDRARVVISISLIQRSVSMEIDEADVEAIS